VTAEAGVFRLACSLSFHIRNGMFHLSRLSELLLCDDSVDRLIGDKESSAVALASAKTIPAALAVLGAL
jgi:hypothetical protein